MSLHLYLFSLHPYDIFNVFEEMLELVHLKHAKKLFGLHVIIFLKFIFLSTLISALETRKKTIWSACFRYRDATMKREERIRLISIK